MKNHQPLIRMLLLFCLISLSCSKTDSPNNKYRPEYVSASIAGRVTDGDGKPVSNATVKAGSSSATTNIDGSFTINNVTIDKNAALIKVEKEGFFLGTKTIVAIPNNNNQVAIMLIKKTLAGTFTSSGGGSIDVPLNGGSITFTASSIINPATNMAYTGTTAVHAFFINPEASNFTDIMPGTLRGITSDNQETGLQSFGMMAVELSGESGEKLQLAPGKKATLRFPIPASLQAEAPATIPLWSMDEVSGLWKQEGSATRQGTDYIGEVSHFSFWNCDAPFPVIEFTATVRNQQSTNVLGAEVVVSIISDNTTAGSISASGFTNADGVVTGKLPANKSLQLKVYDKCRTLLHSQNIGPFTTTTNLGVITVNSSPAQVTFSGSVKNCSNNPVSNGFVTVRLENIYYNIPVTNGNFNTTITRCSNTTATATITAFDAVEQQKGPEVNVSVSDNTVNVGELTSCGATSDTYIQYTLGSTSYYYEPPADTLFFYTSQAPNSQITTAIECRGMSQQFEDMVFMFRGQQQTPGIYPVLIIDIAQGSNTTVYLKNGEINASITEYGPPGGYVSGTFSGSVRDVAGTTVIPINCSFRVKRQ